MGFPIWTLWGMVLSAVVALILLGYSLYTQSRSAKAQLMTEPYRFERRVRRLTAGAFASLLLMFGFFIAGVPTDLVGYAMNGDEAADVFVTDEVVLASVESAETRTESGAFGGPPPTTQPETIIDDAVPTLTSDSIAATPALADDETENTLAQTPTPTIAQTVAEDPTTTPSPTPTPTLTPTPTPTETPVPTLTPTPIEDPTGMINTGGGTVWIHRSPGGGNLAIVNNGDTVILRTGHANQAGFQWREIMTVDGVTGWIQIEFLELDT